MKIKFLSILSSLAIIPLLMTSCLKSDNEQISLSTDTTVYNISIGEVAGKTVPLSIDLKKALIYNVEPLPYGSDTIINKTVFKNIQTTTGFLTRKKEDGNDTIFAYAVDTIDLTHSFEFTVHAMAPETNKTYTVNINYFKNDPEELRWESQSIPFELGSNRNLLTQVKNSLFIYTPEGKGYQYKNSSWSELNIQGLPENSTIKSVASDLTTSMLYLLTAEELIYQSEDGELWQPTDWGTDVTEMLLITPSSHLLAIRTKNEVKEFTQIDLSKENKEWLVDSSVDAQVPSDFPVQNITATYNTQKGYSLLMGQPDQGKNTLVWMTESGSKWTKLNFEDSASTCPYFTQPQLFFLNNKYYAFDGMKKDIYTSRDGINWTLSEEKFLLPSDYKNNGASVLVDNKQTLWLLEKAEDKIWMGVLNLFNESLN